MTNPMNLNEARRLNAIRDRLVDALKYERSLPGLRERMVELASDIEAWRDGRVPSSVAFRAVADTAPTRDTVPCPAPDSASDSAPCVSTHRPSGGP